MNNNRCCDENVNPIIKRIAVKIECEFIAPALIGSGENENTDSDVIRYKDGTAYLPGSAVAGVLCSISDDIKNIFSAEARQSPLWVYDARLFSANGGEAEIIELDGVELENENKVAKDKKKYDYEAVEAGTKVELRFLLNIRKNDADNGETLEAALKKIVGAIKSGNIAFGAKTQRGFGVIKYINGNQREFNLSNGCISELNEWIGFDWKNSTNEWDSVKDEPLDDGYVTIKAKLELNGSIMIRDTRNIYEDAANKDSVPDYKHLSVNRKPVILGTSWAGAFRSGLYRLLVNKYSKETVDEYLGSVFGFVTEEGNESKAEKSRIYFSMSYLETGDEDKVDNSEIGYRNITRVKIDRFTGGAANGALFTERPWYGGQTEVEIRFPKDCDDVRELILLGLDAIDKGLIQIGGEASVGRGFFKIAELTDTDGKTYNSNELGIKLFQTPKTKLTTALTKTSAVKVGDDK